MSTDSNSAFIERDGKRGLGEDVWGKYREEQKDKRGKESRREREMLSTRSISKNTR